MTEALAIMGILLAIWLAAKCEGDAADDYAKGMDEYHLQMRKVHGDAYVKRRAEQREKERQ